MPHVWVIAAVGTVALAGYKLARREMRRVGEMLADAPEPQPAPVLERGDLVRGPDGIYRPGPRKS